MKSIVLTTAFAAATTLSFSQYCSPWPTTNPNTGQSGYVGIGTRASSGPLLTPLPNFNLHLHGTTDYIYNDGVSGMNQSDSTYISGHTSQFQTKTITNYGKTTRLGMTNSTTGMTEADGTVLRMSDNDFTLHNRETGYVSLKTSSIEFKLSGTDNRAYLGSGSGLQTSWARLNVFAGGLDNGLFIDVVSESKYGLSIRSSSSAGTAIQVIHTGASSNTFLVKNNGYTEINTVSTVGTDKLLLIKNPNKKLLQLTNDGILRSREIIVDAQSWSDYVFAPEYKLMPLSELRSYINTNGHLPNVPSTAEAEGVNVAKTDAILLEKIEELTLYLLQQEERMKALEAEIQALKKEESGN